MRISCAVPRELVSKGLIAKLEALGLQPIVTNQIVRAVYEGDDHKLGTQIVLLFEDELNHDIVVDYGDELQARRNRRSKKRTKK